MKLHVIDQVFSAMMLAQGDVVSGNQHADFLKSVWTTVKQNLSVEAAIRTLSAYGPQVLAAIAVFVFGRMGARFASGIIIKAFGKARVDETVGRFMGNLVYVAMLTAVCICALGQLGVDTTSLSAVLAAMGFAIGMALQGSLGNVASGILLVFMKPFRVGDQIDVGGVVGRVVEIQIYNTILLAPDNVRIILPNSTITSGIIRNLSAEPLRRIDLVVSCSYNDDLRAVRQFLEEVVVSDSRILKEPAAVVAVSELAESSVNFVVRPWVASGNYNPVRFDLTERIKLGFDDRGFTIPFPSRDVFVHQAGNQLSLSDAGASTIAA